MIREMFTAGMTDFEAELARMKPSKCGKSLFMVDQLRCEANGAFIGSDKTRSPSVVISKRISLWGNVLLYDYLLAKRESISF